MDDSTVRERINSHLRKICKQAIRNAKNKLRPYENDYWCIPAKEAPKFIAYMEDVLDVYKLHYDTKRPRSWYG